MVVTNDIESVVLNKIKVAQDTINYYTVTWNSA